MAEKFATYFFGYDQWNAKVVVMIGGERDQHEATFRKYKIGKAESAELADWCRDEMRDSFGVTLQPQTKPGVQVVYFPRRPNLANPVHVGMVGHELFHAVTCILRRAEVRLTHASEEAFAYLLGHLMQQFWRRMKVKPAETT